MKLLHGGGGVVTHDGGGGDGDGGGGGGVLGLRQSTKSRKGTFTSSSRRQRLRLHWFVEAENSNEVHQRPYLTQWLEHSAAVALSPPPCNPMRPQPTQSAASELHSGGQMGAAGAAGVGGRVGGVGGGGDGRDWLPGEARSAGPIVTAAPSCPPPVRSYVPTKAPSWYSPSYGAVSGPSVSRRGVALPRTARVATG